MLLQNQVSFMMNGKFAGLVIRFGMHECPITVQSDYMLGLMPTA